MHSPAWIEARTLRLPDDTTPVELNAHPLFCTIQRTKRVRLTFPVTITKKTLGKFPKAVDFEDFRDIINGNVRDNR